MKTPKAIAFDVDGTLTEFGAWSIPIELRKTLANLPLHIELALCSGRPLARQKERLQEILDASENPEEQRHRWTLITDNGCTANRWNEQAQDWQLLFQIEWPEEKISKSTLAQKIRRHFFHLMDVQERQFVVVLLFPRIYFFPRITQMLAILAHRRLKKLLARLKVSNDLTTESSGLGSLIFPIEAGKGKAIKRWTQHLQISKEDTVCVGDRPDIDGNDREFLSGQFGHAFTVGHAGPQAQPVFDAQNRPMKGPTATRHLLSQFR